MEESASSSKLDRPELSLDKSSEQGFCSFFTSLPDKAENTVRLFERNNGDYYSVHGDDAHFVAQTIYKTSSVIKYLGGGDGLPSCTMSKLTANVLLKDLLLAKLYRVEIWGNTEARKGGSWKIVKRASPGNLQDIEDMLFSSSEISSSPVVMAVKIEITTDQKLVGIAYTDATTMLTLGVAQFIDNDTFSNLEALLIQLSVKECLIADEPSSYHSKKVNAILERCGIIATLRKRGDFLGKDVEQDLNRLLCEETNVAARPEFELKVAMASAGCLIKYLSLMSDPGNFGQYNLEHHDLSQYMRLDGSAVKALNIMPGPHDGSNKNMSLLGLLNKCKTAQGSRLLAQWLKQPLMNLEDIHHRHDIVEYLINNTELRQSLQESLKSFPDLHRLARRLHRGNASLQDVVRIYQVIVSLEKLKDELETQCFGDDPQTELINSTYTERIKELLGHIIRLKTLIESAVDLQAADSHSYMIRPSFEGALQEMRDKMDHVSDNIFPEVTRVADDLGMELDKKLKFEQSSQYGHHLRLSRNDASSIRGSRSYIELSTQKAGVLFTTPTLKKLSADYYSYLEQYETLQQEVVKKLIEVTVTYNSVLEHLNQLVAHLDVLLSFAHVSLHAPTPYTRPKLTPTGEGNIKLLASRHPCLEMQDGVSFIANDVVLERGTSEFQIITGPNMGGKSTYIRQIGVTALMAQIGCFVPCDSASLCLFDSILARVGAGDSQLKGVSTFMAEMLETSSILKAASSNSLIIIDELGRGTSTYDGFGLAWAISWHIATKLRCFCLFATHFHELTALAEKVPSVKNKHVQAVTDENSITLLYRVLDGFCDQSFGIHVAELAKFPESVVKLAKRKAAELENFSSDGEDLGRPWKCSKEDIEHGNDLIERFLGDLARTPGFDKLGDSEANAVVDGLLDKYGPELKESAFVQEIMAELSSREQR
ncbi:muts domain V-domain-containing protein [Polychytrium aggregatum]|uniref:muts domain V-domain-containing protein n=1 Tax=Polychytrium aggregatum TaxID=110093 RepID=UPI0022FDDCF9|nr:muts domain V-domain-containing protein [Polychytrium aggregatum]KAI9206685.1 muts domain V-domain-containing protein [Polychytrium aggregatum]